MHASLIWTSVFAGFLLLHVMLRLWLHARQVRAVAGHRDRLPAPFEGALSLASHQRAADYTVARVALSSIHLAWGAAVLLAWTLMGGLDLLNRLTLSWLEPGLVQQLVLLGLFVAVSSALELPWSWYQTFRLEQRFGFNRSTLGLWLLDGLKASALLLVIGLPLAATVLWLMQAAGAWWWAWTWALWLSFNLLMLWLYPSVIAPWFNRFTPLGDAALTARIETLVQRSGFRSGGVFVMDGSRRSAHANAYFTGLGAHKRVVFFDTLLSKLSHDQIEAVLAHELGHFHHGHIRSRLLWMALSSLAALAILGWVSQQAWFFTGLGVTPSFAFSADLQAPNDALALILFTLALPVFTWAASPLSAALSRRHEFEADRYAVAQTSAASLSQALVRLYEDNASTLTPDPLYVAFHYSHPPALQRLQRMGDGSVTGGVEPAAA